MAKSGYLLGLDSGTSSIKATLLDTESGRIVASTAQPKTEMEILAPQAGWAEQDPALWWENTKKAVAEIREKTGLDLKDVAAIGISYQMHGLVMIDKGRNLLRPAIIWCDSRAVPFGEKALSAIGKRKCLSRLLNSPGNFTASKLAWVKKNESAVFRKIHKIMLPGDYIAMMLGGSVSTTPSGLSEAIMWDFTKHELAGFVLDYFGFPHDIIPPLVPTFSVQGEVSTAVAGELGLKAGTPISYRGGDQPNNALSLKVLEPGEIAATAGTSGVVYGVANKPTCDKQSRVNTFVHVNYSKQKPRYGVLLCVNATGILFSWLKHNCATAGGQRLDYPAMDSVSLEAPVGCDGLVILPYGNGAERTLQNRDLGASVHGLNLNLHRQAHVFRAAQEGIAFALNHGLEIMKGIGVNVKTVRAGNVNMFRSPLFKSAFATLSGARLELYSTDGSQGAARGAGIGAGVYASFSDAFAGLTAVETVEPNKAQKAAYRRAYARWLAVLERQLTWT